MDLKKLLVKWDAEYQSDKSLSLDSLLASGLNKKTLGAFWYSGRMPSLLNAVMLATFLANHYASSEKNNEVFRRIITDMAGATIKISLPKPGEVQV